MVSLHNRFEKLVVKSRSGLEGYLSLCLVQMILTRFLTDWIIEFVSTTEVVSKGKRKAETPCMFDSKFLPCPKPSCSPRATIRLENSVVNH